jgi:LacI family transcriptional regulator
MVTGRDVARLAGVSQTTVSRVLRNDPKVSGDTHRRVMAAAATLSYSPNIVARTLLTGSSKTVAILVPDVSNVVNPQFIRAAQEVFAAAGYDSLLINHGPHDHLGQIAALSQRMVEGVLLAAASDTEGTLVGAIARQALPLTLAIRGTDDPEFDSFIADDESGCRQAVDLLVGYGHRNIAMVSGPELTTTGRDRARHFAAALHESGIPLPPERVMYGDYSFDSGERAAESLMRSEDPPTAIFCASDNMAFGVLNALLKAGVDVPGDVSVIGFDDTPIAAWRMVGLTTISQPVVDMTRAAAQCLLERMRGGGATAAARTYPVELIERSTTGPVART